MHSLTETVENLETTLTTNADNMPTHICARSYIDY